MPITVTFTPAAMTAQQYDEVIARLEAAGAGTPPGRQYHVCFGTTERLYVVDIWDAMTSFEAFGQTLMPILQAVGVDAGRPEIADVHRIIEG